MSGKILIKHYNSSLLAYLAALTLLENSVRCLSEKFAAS